MFVTRNCLPVLARSVWVGGGREGARGAERHKNKQVIVEALYLGLEDLEVSNNNYKIVNKEKKGSS